MNFIRNKHVKLDETCIDTQGRLKANLPNIMEVLGRSPPNIMKHDTQTINTILTHIMTSLSHETQIVT